MKVEVPGAVGNDRIVTRRAAKDSWFPIRLPKKPEFAKDESVKIRAQAILSRIRENEKRMDLCNPWSSSAESLRRRHIYFASGWHKVRCAMPGFGMGLAAFAIYAVSDYLWSDCDMKL